MGVFGMLHGEGFYDAACVKATVEQHLSDVYMWVFDCYMQRCAPDGTVNLWHQLAVVAAQGSDGPGKMLTKAQTQTG